jgi:glycopeptide antibiotics resistance protein
VAWLTFLPLPVGAEAIEAARRQATYDHNAVPLATLAFQLRDGLTPHEIRQIVGNVMLLLPLGVYGPAVWRPMRRAAVVLLVAAAASALVELGQLGLATSYGFPVRVADVDDVLLNAIGAVGGWLIWVAAVGRPIESTRHAVRHAPDRS